MISIRIGKDKSYEGVKNDGRVVNGYIDDDLFNKINDIVENTKTGEDIQREIIQEYFKEKTDKEVLEKAVAVPEWKENVKYLKGDKVRYQGEIYEVLFDQTASLFNTPMEDKIGYILLENKINKASGKNTSEEKVAKEYPEWVEPDSFSKGYNKGDRVKYMNRIWESLRNYNKESPIDGGWMEV